MELCILRRSSVITCLSPFFIFKRHTSVWLRTWCFACRLVPDAVLLFLRDKRLVVFVFLCETHVSHTFHELCPSSKPLIVLNNLPKHLEANRLKLSTVCLFIKDSWVIYTFYSFIGYCNFVLVEYLPVCWHQLCLKVSLNLCDLHPS